MLKIENLRKVFRTDEIETIALDNVSFAIEKGEFVAVMGPSGCGKSTLLNILGLLDNPTSGSYTLLGQEVSAFREKDRTLFRKGNIGFVFQFYNLVPNLTALENVELASQICPDHFDPADTLHKGGLGDRLSNFPAQLSGGEQQRVSIARAIAKKPKLLLCDEPTGALDYETGKEVLQLLQDICRDENMTVLIITHNSALAPMAHKVIRFRSGKVVGEDVNPAPTPIADIEW